MIAGNWAQLDLAGHDHDWLREQAEATFTADEACALVLNLDGARFTPFDGPWWLVRYPLPVIAAAESDVHGGAFNLAIACDIRVIADNITIGSAGEGAAGIGWDRLEALLGTTTALLVENDGPWTAARAHDEGVVTVTTPPGSALAEAQRLAAVIASRGPIAVRLAKEAIWRGLPLHLEQGLRFETDLTLLLQTTKDRAEGVTAFLEKRQPRFAGE